MFANYTLSALGQTLLGICAFAPPALAPGYVLLHAADILGFRRRSLPEKLLWSLALSLPLSILLTSIAARFLPFPAVVAVLAALTAGAAVLILQHLRQAPRPRIFPDRDLRITCLCMAGFAAYCVLATLPLQTPHSLYENIAVSDLCVRMPLVQAAARGGLPPHNPLFAVAGVAPPLRYYYFWYELCALVMRCAHISARSAFTASSVWAGYSLIAVLFLFLKYLAPLAMQPPLFADSNRPAAPAPLRRICLIALGLVLVMGLDIIPALAGLLFFHRVRLMADIEFWRPDRMPSWPGAVIVAPHHIAGIALGALAFLFLALLPDSRQPNARRQRLLHALCAAFCFAALIGTSTYLALCFGFAIAILAAVHLRHARWAELAVFALFAVFALVIALPFLHEVTANPGYVAATQHYARPSVLGNHAFKIVLRNWHFSYGVIGYFAYILHLPFLHNPLRYIFPLTFLPFLYLGELTFYVFVIYAQARATRRSPSTPQRTALWALFWGIALPALLLNSEPTQQVNDLGRHAGLALRLVLIVWAAPLFANARAARRSGQTFSRSGRWIASLTLAMVVLGLAGQTWQIVMNRIYFVLVAHERIHTRLFRADTPYLAIQKATAAAATLLPPGALLQSNPEGSYQPLYLLYGDHPLAAGDSSCLTAFGGNVDLCRTQVMPPLHRLFGGSGLPVLHKSAPDPYAPPSLDDIPPDPAFMTIANLAATCSALHLTAVFATRRDPAWNLPNTWVWRSPTLYASDTVRLIPCPTPPSP